MADSNQAILHRFNVTFAEVKAFAELIGDKSSLHIDPQFGAQSRFGKNIVHGFLPLMLLSTLQNLWKKGEQLRLTSLSVHFRRPLFLNIPITCLVMPSPGNEGRFEFSIVTAHGRTIISSGHLEVAYDAVRQNAQIVSEPPSSSMLPQPLIEKSYPFAALKKGIQNEFSFQMNPSHTFQLYSLLKNITSLDHQEWVQSCNVPSFLHTALCSTLIGMRLPGKTATFTSAELSCKESFSYGEDGLVRSTISFLSEATATVVQKIEVISQKQETVKTMGTISAQVEKEDSVSISISDIKERTKNLGLTGKTILVTGASRGIGETIAKLLSTHGAQVAINYLHNRERAETVCKEIETHGGTASCFQGDVTVQDSVASMIQNIHEKFGDIDILINNAGTRHYPEPFLDLSWETIQQDLDLSTKGAFYCCKAVLPHMIKKEKGKIINIASIVTEAPPPHQCGYVLAKSALIALTRSLAVEFAPHNILVNAVVPSLIETDLNRGLSEVTLFNLKKSAPLKRLAEPLDVAEAVLYLASSLSSYTSGQQLMVTGGLPPFL